MNEILEDSVIPDIKGKIHSGLLREKAKGPGKDEKKVPWLILFDKGAFYKINTDTKACKAFKSQKCIGICFLDKNYCYTLNHKSAKTSSGFKVYDIRTVIEKDSDFSYPLVST